jgi:hypothetical protein
MVSGITPCAQECKWTDYFGEPPKSMKLVVVPQEVRTSGCKSSLIKA